MSWINKKLIYSFTSFHSNWLCVYSIQRIHLANPLMNRLGTMRMKRELVVFWNDSERAIAWSLSYVIKQKILTRWSNVGWNTMAIDHLKAVQCEKNVWSSNCCLIQNKHRALSSFEAVGSFTTVYWAITFLNSPHEVILPKNSLYLFQYLRCL